VKRRGCARFCPDADASQRQKVSSSVLQSIRLHIEDGLFWPFFFALCDSAKETSTESLAEMPKMIAESVKQQGLCSIPEAAKFLSLSRAKVYQAIDAGDIPSKRFGRSVRIPWAWLYAQAEVNNEDENR